MSKIKFKTSNPYLAIAVLAVIIPAVLATILSYTAYFLILFYIPINTILIQDKTILISDMCIWAITVIIAMSITHSLESFCNYMFKKFSIKA